MNKTPLVYIIVLSWNGKEDTLACLRSLEEINYPNYKILLVDNASSDGTVAAVAKQFPRVELIVNSHNLRYAGGNNVGIQRALEHGSEYVLLLNNDTIVDKEFLQNLVMALDQRQQYGMAGPKIYFHGDHHRLWYAGGKIEWWKGWISHVGVREIDRGQYDTQSETGYITGCCLLVKREVIEKIGTLDERYYIYGEDSDWCIRCVRAGYKLLYVPSAVIWHKLSVSSGGHFSWFKNWNKLKSQLRLMSRYASWYHWLTIPFGLSLNVLKSFFRVKRIDL